MRPTWLVAKYIEDVRRREPRNVGVLLFTDDGVIDRFVGQRGDGAVDGRSTPLSGPHLANYKAWVSYWRACARSGAQDPRSLVDVAPADTNYFLEFGGEQLTGDATPDQLADQLFDLLVGTPSKPKRRVVREAAERVFRGIRIADAVERDPRVQRQQEGVLDVLRFDYRYDNGRPHLMQAVAPADDDSGWTEVHHAIYLFEKLREVQTLDKPNAIALTHGTAAAGPLKLLATAAPVIDLASPDAAGTLAEALRVATRA